MKITRSAGSIAVLAMAASLSVAATEVPDGCYAAIPDDPATEDVDETVVACEEQHWFHRSTSHAQNLGYVDETGTHGLATFDTNPPAGSVSGGNGGGYLATDLAGNDGDLAEAQFRGTFTGVLDRMDFDLHNLVSDEDTLQGDVTFSITVKDGTRTIATFDQISVLTKPEPRSAAGSTRLDFAITGLAEYYADRDRDNAADTEHEITVIIKEHWTNRAVVWAFDTEEVPGGITFNKVELEEGTLELPR